jgi:hypothetical protein
VKRKPTGIEKHVRAWARRRIKFTERELASLDKQIKNTTDIRQLRALKKVRKTVATILVGLRGWAEAHL